MIVRQTPGGVEVRVKVVPGASQNRIAGPLGDALKIQVSAAPEGGKANAAVARLLAARLHVPVGNVTLIRGATQARKTFLISGISLDQAHRLLAPD